MRGGSGDTKPPHKKTTQNASFHIPDMSCFDFTLIFCSTDLDLDLEAEDDLHLELCTFSAGGGAGAGAGAGETSGASARSPGGVAGGTKGLLGGGALEVVVCGMGGGWAGAGKRTTGTCGAN